MTSFAKKKTLVLSITRDCHLTLLNVAARRNLDVEVLVEDLIERSYSRDGKLNRERDRENQAREEAERKQRLGLASGFVSVGEEDHRLPIHDADTEAEIRRLLSLVEQ